MKIFVCEFITGGGLYRESLPSSLAQEGTLMRDALLSDLAAIPDTELITTHDVRTKPPAIACECIEIKPQDDIWEVWHECIAQAEAVWLIAPETGGILLRLTELVSSCNKTLLGSTAQAVEIASSKYSTFQVLAQAGINTLPTYRYTDWLQFQSQAPNGWGWVAKMDDGAGCEDSAYFDDTSALDAWMQTRQASHIIQAYQPGIPASISMLCKHGRAWLLSCNQQKIDIVEGSFSYSGSLINGLTQHSEAFENIAQQVAQALPGLAGYIGIDVIVDADDVIHVLEINPRLTTSYTGLHEAINCNPAKLVLDLLLYNDAFVMPDIACQKVEVTLHA